MIPWECIDSGKVPGSDREISLYRRGSEFSIRVNGMELMNSRMHGSEDALAEQACRMIAAADTARVLVGGLGMGFTASAALRSLGPGARLVAVELVPKVVEWNRKYLGSLANHPLEDPRMTLRTADVAQVVGEETAAWDIILLDVDNGPKGLTSRSNDRIYGEGGLACAFSALRPGGVLGVWSAEADPAFIRRLRRAGFAVDETTVRARGSSGARHTLWFCRRPRR